MPELPEVEVIKKGLEPILRREIIEAKLFTARLRADVNLELCNLLKNKLITGVRRRAKYILIDIGDNLLLIIHLGMTGKLILIKDQYIMQKHDHFLCQLSDGRYIVFNDQRRFGMIWLIDSSWESQFFAKCGPEPLSDAFNYKYLSCALKNKTKAIKSVIMDSNIVVGVGNIYASESLFYAAIHPLREASSLNINEVEKLIISIKIILQKAIEAGGSTLKDYVQSDGKIGYFQHQFAVYGRAGKNCGKCGTGIEKITIAARSSFFCPRCQN